MDDKKKAGKPPAKPRRRKKPKPVNIGDFADLIDIKSNTFPKGIAIPESKAGNRNYAYLTAHAARTIVAETLGRFLDADINKVKPAELKDLCAAMKMCNEMCDKAMENVKDNEVGGILVKQGSVMQGLVSHLNKIRLVSDNKDITEKELDEGLDSIEKLKVEKEKIIDARTVDLSDALGQPKSDK